MAIEGMVVKAISSGLTGEQMASRKLSVYLMPLLVYNGLQKGMVIMVSLIYHLQGGTDIIIKAHGLQEALAINLVYRWRPTLTDLVVVVGARKEAKPVIEMK
jgi:hypothetical protein